MNKAKRAQAAKPFALREAQTAGWHYRTAPPIYMVLRNGQRWDSFLSLAQAQREVERLNAGASRE